ncbi:MAG: hypothetical protein B7X08_05270 [Acidocella sp. 20-63-7]|nr:MAG: hypothetical protein B7X08_05270 [Acidocella sp. 20-63-7]
MKAHPGAKRAQIGPVIAAAPAPGWPDGRLRVSIQAAPEDGRANAAILRLLAKFLGVKPAVLTQEAGQSARDKKFLLSGGRWADIAERFAGL